MAWKELRNTHNTDSTWRAVPCVKLNRTAIAFSPAATAKFDLAKGRKVRILFDKETMTLGIVLLPPGSGMAGYKIGMKAGANDKGQKEVCGIGGHMALYQNLSADCLGQAYRLVPNEEIGGFVAVLKPHNVVSGVARSMPTETQQLSAADAVSMGKRRRREFSSREGERAEAEEFSLND